MGASFSTSRSEPGIVGEGLGGGGGANFGQFLQLPCGARPIFRRWLLGFFRARFSESILGQFW